MRNSKFLLAAPRSFKFLSETSRSFGVLSGASKESRFLAAAIRNQKVFFAAIFVFFFSSIVHAPLQMNDSERQLFESLNHARTAQGLSVLQWHNALFKATRRQALTMLNLTLREP